MAVRELLNCYVALEEYVMEQDVRRAVSIRNHPPGCLTTSMVPRPAPSRPPSLLTCCDPRPEQP